MYASTLLYIFCCRTLSYPTRTRPEFRFRFRWNLGWYQFRSSTGRFDRYQTGTTIFFMLDYRFSLFLLMSYLHHVLPYSSLAETCAPLQSPDCITTSRATLHFPDCITTSRALLQFPDCITTSRAALQFPDCITCFPPVPRLYHVLHSHSSS